MYIQPVLVFWTCNERNLQQHKQHTAPRAATPAEVSTVVVRTATPTPDLGQLPKLPRHATHCAGASSRTIKNDLFFFRPTLWLILMSACSTPYTSQAVTVQRSDQHKHQGVSHARRTSRHTGVYKDTTPILTYLARAKPAQLS